MSRVLLFSDVHVHPHKRKVERLEDCLRTLEWVFDVAAQEQIDDILFGGDLFHDRQKIEVYTYQRTFQTIYHRMKTSKLNLYLLLGNHDLWFNEKTSISSVFPLSAIPRVRLISKPERLNIAGANWDFIPFTHNPVAAVADLKALPGDPQYALGHIALDGALLHGNSYSDVVIEHDGDMVTVSADIFSHYQNVFLGHYHAQQKINSIVEYIGSPLQLSFGEAFQDKHIIIFDCETRKKQYVKNTFSPRHLILKEADLDKHDLNGNFVQIVVEEIGASNLVDMRRSVTEKNAVASLEIKQRKKKIDEHVIEDAKAILFKEDEMLARYVDEVGTNNLDRNRLLQIGRKICQTNN